MSSNGIDSNGFGYLYWVRRKIDPNSKELQDTRVYTSYNDNVCEGQDELVAVLGTKLTKSLIRYIPLPPIYTLGLILSPKPPRVHPDLHMYA